MIQAIIVDDEASGINRLSSLLKNHDHTVRIAGTFMSVDEGVSAIHALQPALVFLDVQIHDKTGFDLLKQFPDIFFDVIFTTAFDKYAVQAFKFCAIDYLLKPVDADDLSQALMKLTHKLSREETANRFEALFHNLKNLQGISKKIGVPTINGITFIEVQDIIRCQSNVNYTTIYLKDKQKLTVAKTLKEFEELLSEYNFYRVHNSHLINLAFIKSYNKGKGGYITMTDNSSIEVSSRRKEEFLKKMTAL
jgi:two-component system, LytTR family, response regulator